MKETVGAAAAVEYARGNGARFVEELKELLRIPSVSTNPEHAHDVRRAAEFVADGLRGAGLENVRLIETSVEPGDADASALLLHDNKEGRKGHPLVYGEWLGAGAEQPTVLLYGHYDVQPAEPLQEWKSPPFEPTERDGNLYARGAVDDKGQMWMHVKALESLLKTGGSLPVNVRVIVEGEEEVGGEGIAAFVREHPDQLKADCALVSDTDMFAPGLPTLCVGLRGMIYTELEVLGARTDLHSGMYGGAAPNPFVALAQIIAKLKREDGRIAIPGFYDGIEEPSSDELKAWRSLPFDEEAYREAQVGSPELTGEPMFSVLERTWARPTMDVHGMPGGFTGAGAKTVIPAKATAKISFRLVPGMLPGETFDRYKAYVEEIVPAGVTVAVRLIHSGLPFVVSTDSPYIRAATAAMAEVFGKETVFVRGGGSIPIIADFGNELGIPTVMMGFGLPDDNLHAPNEKFNLGNFHKGIESVVRFLSLMGESDRQSTQGQGAGRDMNLLPVHGFVLAGGRSSRMGRDKAMLPFAGRPMVQIAVEKLLAFCPVVSVVGEREDLHRFAPVVLGERPSCGPAAGIEAGLRSCTEPWALFTPVDVPLMPAELLARWVSQSLALDGVSVSNLWFDGEQPGFCLLRRDTLAPVTRALDGGERKLLRVLDAAADAAVARRSFRLEEVYGTEYAPSAAHARWFNNLNTPDEWLKAESHAPDI